LLLVSYVIPLSWSSAHPPAENAESMGHPADRVEHDEAGAPEKVP